MNNQNSNGYHNNRTPNSNGHNGHFPQHQMQNNNPSTQPNDQTSQPQTSQPQTTQPNNNNNNNVEILGKQTWEALMKLHAQNTSNEERTAADRFLSKYLPNQQCCWHIFTKFLTTDSIPHEAHFFAANMLRSKIQRNLHQVPQQHHQGLHQMIMTALINFNKKGQQYENVRTQLSIALALLVIQRTDWENEVPNIIHKLAKTETLDILLNILTRLAEELYTFHIPISSKIKTKASNILRKHASLVLKLLHDLFQMVSNNNLSNKLSIKLKIFKCFAAWLDFMDTHFSDYMNNYSVLTKICFESLENDQLFKEACTCISKILRLSDGDTRSYYEYEEDERKENQTNDQNNNPNQNNNNEMNNLMKRQFNILVPNIIKLKEMYNRSIVSDDSEKSYALCRLFVDTAEHYCDWIISPSTNARESEELIKIILLCSQHNDCVISTYTCAFWEQLFRPFVSIVAEFRKRAEKEMAVRLESQDEYNRPWPDWCLPYVSINNGLIIRVCHNIVIASKLPVDFDDMDIDEQEEALHARWGVADVVTDISEIIGLLNVFNILYEMLKKYIEDNNQNNNNEQADIYQCEAILFCIRTTPKSEINRFKNQKQSHPLFKIFKLLPLLGTNHHITSMCVQLISVHCGFIQPKVDIEIFANLYKYIFNGLIIPGVGRQSVKAIRSLCEKFSADKLPSNFILSLFNIYENDNQNILNLKSKLILIESITVVISTFKNSNDIRRGIKKLLNKQIQKMNELMETQNANGSDYNSPLYDTMNCISCMFKFFKPNSVNDNNNEKNLNVLLLEDIWPHMKKILTKYCLCDGIMEKATRIIKHVIRNSIVFSNNDDFINSFLCIEILKLVTDLYCNQSQRSSFLYIIWTYVDEYIEKSSAAAKELITTLIKTSQCTFQILLNDDKSFDKNADIVEDFYELLIQYIKKSNNLLIQNKQSIQFLYLIFKKAIHGILLDQYKPNDAICTFYVDFLYYIPDEITNKLLFDNNDEIANQIIFKILYGLSGQVRWEIANNLADLLAGFYKYEKKKFKNIVVQIINQNKYFQNIKCNDPNNNEFINQYFDEKKADSKKKRCKIAINWWDSCQRYLKSTTF